MEVGDVPHYMLQIILKIIVKTIQNQSSQNDYCTQGNNNTTHWYNNVLTVLLKYINLFSGYNKTTRLE